ncbi:MAG: C40 family peptidase, partial [Rubricella sp.]
DHHVIRPLALVYAEPDLKGRPIDALPFLARVSILGQSGRWLETEAGWVPGRHLSEAAPAVADWVSVAERFEGAPYLWGGRSTLGIDCSALVQLSLMAAGRDCPRDSDMQAALGSAVSEDAPLRRGDLVFWKGHVGVMLDGATLLHANAFHMATVREPLNLVRDRIEAMGDGPVTGIRRL